MGAYRLAILRHQAALREANRIYAQQSERRARRWRWAFFCGAAVALVLAWVLA